MLLFAASVLAQERYALVIGNSQYGQTQLPTPNNNAKLMRDALSELNFLVATEFDADRAAMRRAVKRFSQQLQASGLSIGVFYFSGIAVQAHGNNYLLPVDASPAHENDLHGEGIEIAWILSQMQPGRAAGRIVLIDTSPRGAFNGLASLPPGLAAMRAPPGFLLGFAAQPDRRATLSASRHSHYAAAVGEALRVPDLPAEALLSRVRRLVAERTGQQQQTWHHAALSQPLVLNASGTREAGGAESEQELWNRARNSAALIERYLQRYPTGIFADEARRQLRTLVPAAVNVLGGGTVFRDCSQCPELVVIEPGSYEMGSRSGLANERPPHHVTISRVIGVGRYEVSFAEWDACVDDGGCSFRPPDRGWGRDRRPVIFVSWQDAQQYVNWLRHRTGEAYRLPTEAEWEYFARGGKRTEYPWGDGPGVGMANCYGCTAAQPEARTLPMGRYAANAFGLFDVIGNVWEWTQDCYVDSYDRAPMDGRAQTSGHCIYRVFRGGSWYDAPDRVRVAFRNGGLPELRSPYVGLRVVREMQ